MTVRSPLANVEGITLTNPTTLETLFIVDHNGVEQTLTASRAGALLSNTGYTGSTGTQGVRGYAGSIGFTGSLGYTGSTGTQGLIGYTGSTGTQGLIGYTGSRSTASGYTGSTGTRGIVGFTGSLGEKGYAGSIGRGIPIGGVAGQILTKLSNTDYDTYWKNNESGFSNTTTNIGGGSAGFIPIQRRTSSTAFISTGSVGNLLQYQAGTTATWVSTSTLVVGYSANSDQTYITGLPATGRTGDQYLTMVSGVNGYKGIGSLASLVYNVTTNLLTVSKVYITDTTDSTSINTGALKVAGGVGIGGAITVSNTATILNSTSATSTTTGALQVRGGAGIKGDLWVGGTIYGTISGSITSANSINGGTVGQLVYQRGTNNTDFVAAGSAGNLLVSRGANASGPNFVSTASIQVGYAVNIIGGGTGSLPYQLAANATRFVPIGTPGYVLTVNPGGTAPIWAPAPTGGGGGTVNVDTAVNLAGGLAGVIPYQVYPDTTAFTLQGNVGEVLISGGTGAPTWQAPETIAVTNLKGGAIGSMVFQSDVNATSFLSIGTPDQVLVVNQDATGPRWKTLLGLPVGFATTATNLENGNQGQIPFQTEPGRTSFAGPGTAGQILVSAGTTSTGPVFTNTSTFVIGFSTNITNGVNGQLVYQSSTSTTGFVGPGTTGQLLVSKGSNAPQYTNTSSITVGFAVNLRNGTAGQIPYQTGAHTTLFFGPGNVGDLLMSDFTNGPSFTGTASIKVGFATLADDLINGAPKVKTVLTATNAIFYPTFVSANNAIATSMSVFTSGTFVINPSTGYTGIGVNNPLSKLDVRGGFITSGNVSSTGGAKILGGYYSSGHISTFGSEYSSGGPVLGYGVWPSTAATGAFVSSSPGTLVRGAYTIAGNSHIWYAGASQTITVDGAVTTAEVMKIDTSGNVGIGASYAGTSGAKLSVNGSAFINGILTATTLTGNIQGNTISSSQVTTALGFTPYNSTNPSAYISGNQSITLSGDVTGTGSTAITTTLANSGVTANTYNNVTVNTKGIVTGGSNVAYITANQNQNTQLTSLGVGTAASGTTGEIRATNEITAYYSDRRLKENVKIIDNAIEKVLTLNGITYTPNDLAESFGYDKTKKLVGLFADEVEAVLPEATRPAPFDMDENDNSKSGENYKTIQYEKLVPLLIEAVKELAKEIRDLKKESSSRSL